MKAIVCTKSGPPDVLQLRKVEKPTLKDSELLIRIYAKNLSCGENKKFQNRRIIK
jgi:NADPH:quinone reductase-like Zn-dependent oxidoreductase